MTKLTVLFAVCLVFLFATASFAVPSLKMEFIGVFLAGRPAIVRVSTNEIDLAAGFSIDSKNPTDVDEGKTYWDNNYIVFGKRDIISNMNPDILEQNNLVDFSPSNSGVVCVDEATHRPFVNLYYNYGVIMYFSIIHSVHQVEFPADNFGSFSFLCPMTIVTTQVYAPEYTILTATHNAGSFDFTFAPPAVWSWKEPVITINSASYSANTGNLLGGKIKFQFSTDTAGIHHVSVRNGPQPIYYNRRNQEFTSYQCGDKVEAYIIQGPTTLQIHVKDSAANGAPITCTVDVDGYMSSAFTERSQVIIKMDTALIAQGIDFPVLDATFKVIELDTLWRSSQNAIFQIEASNLSFSSSPLHTNSTVEIRFTGIDVNTHQQTNTEYRQDVVCSDLQGTFSQDSKSVFIKDVSNFVDSFACELNFVGSKIVRLDEFTPVPTVQVLVDGVMLYNRAVRSTSFPLYLPANTKIESKTSQIYQDESTIKHVVQFSLTDQSELYGVVPRNPVLALSYFYAATWSIASYADVLSCEATSPSSSAYTPLAMTFNLARRVWTADLSNLINTDVYRIKFRCTRSESVVNKFGIVQNTANQLVISFIDLSSGKSYNYSTNDSIDELSPKVYLKVPTNPALPTDFTQYFSFESYIFITDFDTVSSVVGQASTKFLEMIKAGFDEYDAQTPATPAKLSPKLINKVQIDPITYRSNDYSPSFVQILSDFYFNIIGHQFQQDKLQSISTYSTIFSSYFTARSQHTTPQIKFSQTFTAGSTYAEIQAFSDASNFVNSKLEPAFYKDAYSISPPIPFIFNYLGFEFPSFSQNQVMNPITACGYYEVAYAATKTLANTNYEFVYTNMATSDTNNQVHARFTCGWTEACVSDADCGEHGYCSKGACAATKPILKYPYVQYDTVSDLSEYDSYNNSLAVSLSAIIVAVIVAMVM